MNVMLKAFPTKSDCIIQVSATNLFLFFCFSNIFLIQKTHKLITQASLEPENCRVMFKIR